MKHRQPAVLQGDPAAGLSARHVATDDEINILSRRGHLEPPASEVACRHLTPARMPLADRTDHLRTSNTPPQPAELSGLIDPVPPFDPWITDVAAGPLTNR